MSQLTCTWLKSSILLMCYSIWRLHRLVLCGLISAAQWNEARPSVIALEMSQPKIKSGLYLARAPTGKPVSDAQCKQQRHHPKRVLNHARHLCMVLFFTCGVICFCFLHVFSLYIQDEVPEVFELTPGK